MKSRFIVIIVILATSVAIFVLARTIVSAVFYDPESEIPAMASARAPGAGISAAVPDAGYPSRLMIPSVGVDAAVQHVGITLKGNIGTPSNFTDAAWYKYGAVPGQAGSAVIDGHVDNGLALAGVFKHLADVKKGDAVYVAAKDGSMLRFAVTSVDLYDYKSVPPDALFSSGGKRLLRLVTCDGAWVPGDKTYGERLIVTAELAGKS